MTELLIDDLKAIPKVLGACLYHAGKGPVEQNFPAPFKTDKLADVGKLLTKIRSAGRMNFEDLTDLSLHYDESVLLTRQLEDNLMVFVLCDPQFNANLVTMSLNLLQEELKSQKRAWAEVISTKEDTRPVATTTTAATPTSALAEALPRLKAPLTKVLGPMASFIFDEVVEQWKASGTRSLDRLLEMIDQEIGDPDKIAKYRRLVAPVLDPASQEG